jgi:hypothetical protein
MNDSMSMLLATTILALGGFGLYMYKSADDSSSKEDYDEDDLFGSASLFNWTTSEDTENEDKCIDDTLEEPYEEIKPRKRGSKTHKNRKSIGSSRRRY